MSNTIEPHEHILGGYVDELAGPDYVKALVNEFPHLLARRGDDNLIRYWRRDKKPVGRLTQAQIQCWHIGYRAALKNWRPKDYS